MAGGRCPVLAEGNAGPPEGGITSRRKAATAPRPGPLPAAVGRLPPAEQTRPGPDGAYRTYTTYRSYREQGEPAPRRRPTAAALPLAITPTDIWRFEDVLPEQFLPSADQGLHEVRTGEASDGVLSQLPVGPATLGMQGVLPRAIQAVRCRACRGGPGQVAGVVRSKRPTVPSEGQGALRGKPRASSRAGEGVGAGQSRGRAASTAAVSAALSAPRDRPPGLAGPGQAGDHPGGAALRGLRERGVRAASSRLQQSLLGGAALSSLPHGEALGRLVALRRRAGEVSRGVPRQSSDRSLRLQAEVRPCARVGPSLEGEDPQRWGEERRKRGPTAAPASLPCPTRLRRRAPCECGHG